MSSLPPPDFSRLDPVPLITMRRPRVSQAAEVLAAGRAQPTAQAPSARSAWPPASSPLPVAESPATVLSNQLLRTLAEQAARQPASGKFGADTGFGWLGGLFGADGGMKADFTGDLAKPAPTASPGFFDGLFSGWFGGGAKG